MLFRSQQLDIMDGGHGPDLFDLRFQRNSVLRLLVCAHSDVTNPLCFHSHKTFQHANVESHNYPAFRDFPAEFTVAP